MVAAVIPMRALKILVVVMGAMLVVGFAALVAVIGAGIARRRWRHCRACAARHVDRHSARRARRGDAAAADRLILALVLPEGGRQLLVIDLVTGVRLGTIELHPTP